MLSIGNTAKWIFGNGSVNFSLVTSECVSAKILIFTTFWLINGASYLHSHLKSMESHYLLMEHKHHTEESVKCTLILRHFLYSFFFTGILPIIWTMLLSVLCFRIEMSVNLGKKSFGNFLTGLCPFFYGFSFL